MTSKIKTHKSTFLQGLMKRNYDDLMVFKKVLAAVCIEIFERPIVLTYLCKKL